MRRTISGKRIKIPTWVASGFLRSLLRETARRWLGGNSQVTVAEYQTRMVESNMLHFIEGVV